MMVWDWLPKYFPLLMHGLWLTILLLVISVVLGFLLSVPLGLAQVTGPKWLGTMAREYCLFMRGTPLLVQLFLIYYGVGTEIFPKLPWLRDSFMWPMLREGFFYAALALTLNFAGYEGEVMRGAFLGVPKGELEAARAMGMSPWKVLFRIWLPRATRIVLPTLTGDIIQQLKTTPQAFLVTVMDLMGVTTMIRQDTYRTYEPLLFLAAIYMFLTFLITRLFLLIERQVPTRR